MDDLLELLKKLLLVYAIVICMLAAPFVVLRIIEVANSDEGLWPSSSYSGATPDCLEWYPAE